MIQAFKMVRNNRLADIILLQSFGLICPKAFCVLLVMLISMLYVVEIYLLLLEVHIPGKKKKKINFAFFERIRNCMTVASPQC